MERKTGTHGSRLFAVEAEGVAEQHWVWRGLAPAGFIPGGRVCQHVLYLFRHGHVVSPVLQCRKEWQALRQQAAGMDGRAPV